MYDTITITTLKNGLTVVVGRNAQTKIISNEQFRLEIIELVEQIENVVTADEIEKSKKLGNNNKVDYTPNAFG